MVSSVLNIWLFIVLLVLLALNIGSVAYFFWIIVWFFQLLFNILSYVGASCNTILNVSWLFTSAVVLLIIMKIYSHLKPWWN